MPYFRFPIQLTPSQRTNFAKAIATDTRVRIIFAPKQIGARPSDLLLLTNKQIDNLLLGKAANKSVYVNFNRTQLRMNETTNW